MTPYRHIVQYYETDRMGIVHHSNYVRWMEEARVDFLERIGFSYAVMEQRGVVSPVRALQCQYRRSCTFGDAVDIAVTITGFNGVVLTIGYDMRNSATGEQVCAASSEHVFLNREGRFIRMKRDLPDFCEAIERLRGEQEESDG